MKTKKKRQISIAEELARAAEKTGYFDRFTYYLMGSWGMVVVPKDKRKWTKKDKAMVEFAARRRAMWK